MDWTKQADDMVKAWTGAQQKMWESWFEVMQSMGTSQSTAGVWEKTVDTWKDAIARALETQVTWTKLWADSVKANAGSSKEVSDWAQQVVDLARTWAHAQAQFSESWFAILKSADPSTLANLWDPNQASKVLTIWQEATRKALEAQREMTNLWPSTASKSDTPT